MKRALITGILGQDAAYLAQQLLADGYTVWGVKRRSASSVPWRLESLGIVHHPELHFIDGDVTDLVSMREAVKLSMPDEVYNTAAMSHVGTSFKQPVASVQINGLGVLHLLEALREIKPDARMIQCSTSELYGDLDPAEQNGTMFSPKSPYATGKLFAYWSVVNYRETFKMFTCNSICHNHESPLRGEEFVTRKITKAVAHIKAGLTDHVQLGNIDTYRDWGHAADYTRAMRMILDNPKAEDWVISTNETHSVREFLHLAFDYAGLGDYEKYVRIDPALYRPSDPRRLHGNSEKIRRELGWKPTVSFDQLVKEMVNEDLIRVGLEPRK